MGTRVGAQKHTPHIDSTSTHSPFAGRLVRCMQYAPTLPAEKSDLKGWREVMSETRGDEYVFHFFMSNRLSNRFPGRGAKAYAPCAFIVYTHALCRAFGRAYAIRPYIAGKEEVSSGRYFPSSRTMRDQYVFHFFISNRLSDRYPCRGAKEYAPCTSIVYPFAPCGAFGRAYAIRPYPAGRKIRFEGLAGGYVWGKGR